MKLFAFLVCSALGWWMAGDSNISVHIGMAIFATWVGVLPILLTSVIRRQRHERGMWAVERGFDGDVQDLDAMESTSHRTEWVPVIDTPEDPNHNAWYSPDHQNVIDPEHID